MERDAGPRLRLKYHRQNPTEIICVRITRPKLSCRSPHLQYHLVMGRKLETPPVRSSSQECTFLPTNHTMRHGPKQINKKQTKIRNNLPTE
jgi:hypothetical protein